jgi:hypothetical protein
MPDSTPIEPMTELKPHPLAPAWVRRAATLAVLVLTMIFGLQGFAAIWVQGPDFEYFYQAGRSLLDHGDFDQGRIRLPEVGIATRGTLDWYLPVVARFMTIWVALGDRLAQPMDAVFQVTMRPVFEWLAEVRKVDLPADALVVTPQRASGVLWLSMNLVVFVTCVRLLAIRVMSLPARDWAVVQIVPLIVMLGAWNWEFWLNQIDALTLLLIVASFVSWQQSRHHLSGLWLGLAVLLKLTPGLVLIWFGLKRQWRVVATAFGLMVLAAPVGDVIAFGPRKAIEANIGWLKRAVFEGSHRALIESQREMDWRNQATGAVLSRLLHPTSYTWKLDNDPRLAAQMNEEPDYVNLVDWPLSTVVMLQAGLTLVMLIGLVWLARQPASRLGSWALRVEWSLFVLAMLWFMPVMRRYHVIMAFPAVCVIATAVHYAGKGKRWSRFANVTLLVVLGIQFTAVRWKFIEPYGGVLFATMLLGGPLIMLRVWLGREPKALSQEFVEIDHCVKQSAAPDKPL